MRFMVSVTGPIKIGGDIKWMIVRMKIKMEEKKGKSFAGFEPTGLPTLVWYGTVGQRLHYTLA